MSDGPAMPDGVEVRIVGAGDPLMDQVAELCYSTLHLPFGVTRQESWNDDDPDSTHIVAMRDGHVVGYARLIVEGRAGHVRQVVVDVAERRRGVAAALVSRALARARELGLPMAFLNARANAVAGYERLGFRVVGEPFRMGRTYLPHVRMELPL